MEWKCAVERDKMREKESEGEKEREGDRDREKEKEKEREREREREKERGLTPSRNERMNRAQRHTARQERM